MSEAGSFRWVRGHYRAIYLCPEDQIVLIQAVGKNF